MIAGPFKLGRNPQHTPPDGSCIYGKTQDIHVAVSVNDAHIGRYGLARVNKPFTSFLII
jgi:hypothetical protein